MQSIIIHRIATTAVMPLIAASGFVGYSYVAPNQNLNQNQYSAPSAMACTVLSSNLYYNDRNNNQNDVVLLQRFFVARGYLRGRVNGYFDQATLNAVQSFQANNRLQVTGFVDSQTRNVIQQISCNGNPSGGYGNGQLSIEGIDAPSQLQVGQSGVWSVHVLSQSNYGSPGQLHYSVVWGDENTVGRAATAYAPNNSVQSTGSFTHVYTRPGRYSPVFTVTDDFGHRTQTSATVSVSSYGNGGYGNGGGNGNCDTSLGQYDRNCYGNGGNNRGGGNNGYCNTNLGSYDRNCYGNNSNGNGGYAGGNSGGNTTYCNTNAGYYDRSCYGYINNTTYRR